MPRLVGNCSIENCENVDALTRGMCQMHYERERRSGIHGTCSASRCPKGVMARGYCSGHYYRWQNDLPMGKPLRKAGRWGPWETTSKGYIRRRMTDGEGRRLNQFQHVFFMEEAIGRPLAPNEEVHHKNGVRDDNRMENLQLWSTRQPKGQHWRDKLEYAREIIALYEPLERAGFHDGESGDR